MNAVDVSPLSLRYCSRAKAASFEGNTWEPMHHLSEQDDRESDKRYRPHESVFGGVARRAAAPNTVASEKVVIDEILSSRGCTVFVAEQSRCQNRFLGGEGGQRGSPFFAAQKSTQRDR